MTLKISDHQNMLHRNFQHKQQPYSHGILPQFFATPRHKGWPIRRVVRARAPLLLSRSSITWRCATCRTGCRRPRTSPRSPGSRSPRGRRICTIWERDGGNLIKSWKVYVRKNINGFFWMMFVKLFTGILQLFGKALDKLVSTLFKPTL